MNEHKDEILRTRKGCLGGSDAKMLMNIANLGYVPKSAYKRLAACKGLIEQGNFTNTAMEFGNYIEDCVFKSLHDTDERWQSNPCLTSSKYSRENCRLIDHVDFFLQDDINKVISIGECKAVVLNFEQTRAEYNAQLMHHYILGCEYAKKLGSEWKVKVMLCHYHTEGLDLKQQWNFETKRLTVKTLRFGKKVEYDLGKAMDIVNSFLADFTEYYDGDEEIPYEILPANVQNQFDSITTLLTEIKEREKKVEEFKRRLYDFMCEKNIKGIKAQAFTITRVDETESKSFDSKRYVEDLKKAHPRKACRIIEQYTKTTKRKGYASVKLKEQKEQ